MGCTEEEVKFQYRKRYEITCDGKQRKVRPGTASRFQYRKRYEITCDALNALESHRGGKGFQYRKRYEITCDLYGHNDGRAIMIKFQYRKRYEITCDDKGIPYIFDARGFNTASGMRSHVTAAVLPRPSRASTFQYRKRYEITCDVVEEFEETCVRKEVSIPQAV